MGVAGLTQAPANLAIAYRSQMSDRVHLASSVAFSDHHHACNLACTFHDDFLPCGWSLCIILISKLEETGTLLVVMCSDYQLVA